MRLPVASCGLPPCPPDLLAAFDSWGATCGPAAIAAATGKTLAEVRPALVAFGGFMNPTAVLETVERMGLKARKLRAEEAPLLPLRGCAHVFFDGPWSAGGARARYAHSHWVAYFRERPGAPFAFYDCNVGPAGGWCMREIWEAQILPTIMPVRGTGYSVNAWIEIS